MIVVGLDVSLSMTGIATYEGVLTSTRFSTEPGSSDLMPMLRRIRRAARGIVQRVPVRFDLAVLELPIPPASGFASLQLERAALFYFLADLLAPRGPLVGVHPKTRAKLATGNGNASKKQVKAAVQKDFPGLRIPDDNVADAVTLAVAGAVHMGDVLVEYSPKQWEAHATVAWPEREGTSQ